MASQRRDEDPPLEPRGSWGAGCGLFIVIGLADVALQIGLSVLGAELVVVVTALAVLSLGILGTGFAVIWALRGHDL